MRGDAVVEADGELDRAHALEVGRVEDWARARLHPRGQAGDPRDGVDRVAEEVAVVQAVALAERPHLLPVARVDERVEHHGSAPAGPRRSELDVVGAQDPRMADDVEREVGELILDRLRELGRRLARRVRDDVELHDLPVPTWSRAHEDSRPLV